MATVTTVSGGSDDIIQIGGSIEEEFPYEDTDGGDLIAFSDGTLVRIRFASDEGEGGIWRITPVARGTGALTIEQAPENDPRNYSDKAALVGPVVWVAHAIAKASAR